MADPTKNTKSEEPPHRTKNGKPPQIALGPVPNLEEHVRPDWWAGLFNHLYLKTDGDVVEDQAITSEEIDLYVPILELSPNDKILDLCCGQGRHTLELARRGFVNVEGIDRSHYLITRARSRAKKEGLTIKFREGDARKLPQAADSFDAVMVMGNSFGYFETAEDDLKVLREISRVLKPGGKVFLDVTDGDYMRENFEKRSWEWLDKKHFVCRERSLSADGQRLISREVITHVEDGVIADQFYAERLYSAENLTSLLWKAGFTDIAVHGQLSPNSQRNQDLGMMAKRILVTAALQKQWTPAKPPRVKPIKELVVVTGDPRLPDSTKLDNIFDEDDFYTLNQMYEGLQSLGKYNLTFLDNHETLIEDLRGLVGKADLVFNLCDEGYENDPRKELHIPALLELFGLPYTGAAPQALAYCYDKSLVRGIAKDIRVPVAPGVFIEPDDSVFELPFAFPAILKPNQADNSVGITRESVVYNAEELLNGIQRLRQQFGTDKPILVEKFLTGKDLTIGLIGNRTSFTIFPIAEEDYSEIPADWPQICGYEAKCMPDSPYWKLFSKPAELPAETEKIIIESSLKMFERLEVRDYARFDWRLDERGKPHLLEVNPNPGWCWDGHMPKMAHLVGISYAEMLDMIIQAAAQRVSQSHPAKEQAEQPINFEVLTIKTPVPA